MPAAGRKLPRQINFTGLAGLLAMGLFLHFRHLRTGALALSFAVLLAVLFYAGFAQAQPASPVRVKVGISAGSAEQVFAVVRKVAEREGLDIALVVFNDYQLPNAALAAETQFKGSLIPAF